MVILGCLFFSSYASKHENQIQISLNCANGVPMSKGSHFAWDNEGGGIMSNYSTLITIAAMSYAVILVYLLHGRYLLNDLCAWNNWKNNIPLAELAALPQKTVYDMLTKSIAIKYNCPTSAVTMNLTLFLQDTTAELETLSSYKSTAQILKSCYVSPLFFVSPESIKQTEEKIKRLRFIQSIVAGELEPTNCVRRLDLINYAYSKCQTLMQRVLGRHH